MKLLVSALEVSSNIHLRALKDVLSSEYELMGIFDRSLGKPYLDATDCSIMGFVDAIKKIPFFLNLKRDMVRLAQQADKVLLMDASGFNLPLAKSIKKAYPNKEIIYYILPQVWASRAYRVASIEAYCDRLCSIIPFERSWYSPMANISYVGHPLLDEIPFFKDHVDHNNRIVFMPGSRRSEIQAHMKVFRELVLRFTQQECVLVIPPHFDETFIQLTYGDIASFRVSHNPYEELYNAEFAFICSGTATLEAALIGTPFVLSYIAKPLDYFIGRNVLGIQEIGLANIFFKHLKYPLMHREYLQKEVTVNTLYHAYQNHNADHFLDNSMLLREYLQQGSSNQVAEYISEQH